MYCLHLVEHQCKDVKQVEQKQPMLTPLGWLSLSSSLSEQKKRKMLLQKRETVASAAASLLLQRNG